jgi:hypothetical protein
MGIDGANLLYFCELSAVAGPHLAGLRRATFRPWGVLRARFGPAGIVSRLGIERPEGGASRSRGWSILRDELGWLE